MAKLVTQDSWNPNVLGSHPIFWPLLPSASGFVESFLDWPTLADYQDFLNTSDNPIVTRSHNKLTIVPQDINPQLFADGYEPRVFLKGELQTRINSWHDFFQVLIWKIFPKTKACINELHFNAMKYRLESSGQPERRSVLENTLTQFDECGTVIISTEQPLLDLIRQFNWHTLFWKKRAELEQHIKCIVFGHAIYEKAINPYIGMTGHAVLLTVPNKVFDLPTEHLIQYLDPLLEASFTSNSSIQTPQDLSPFPLLGLPGWHPDNCQESFYKNANYFRPGRKQKN